MFEPKWRIHWWAAILIAILLILILGAFFRPQSSGNSVDRAGASLSVTPDPTR